MSWESFNWGTLLWIGGIALLVFFMMRGGGCCGMGGRRHGPDMDQDEESRRDSPERKT